MQNTNLFAIYTDILNNNGFQYFITGSVASIVYGESRLTHDIDLVVILSENQIDQFIKVFPSDHFYCPPKEVIKTELNRSVRGHFNLIHHETGFKADIYFTGKDKLQLWALENRKPIECSGNTIYVAPPEYVILKKLEFFKEGNSSKHISDIKGILTNSKELIDFDFLNKELLNREFADAWNSLINE